MVERHLIIPSSAVLQTTAPNVTLFTDASNTGWGAVCGETTIPGKFSPEEKSLTINTKELLAIWKGIKYFEDKLVGKSFLVHSDNTTLSALC